MLITFSQPYRVESTAMFCRKFASHLPSVFDCLRGKGVQSCWSGSEPIANYAMINILVNHEILEANLAIFTP